VIGLFNTVVVDCPDPRALADFYSRLLGLPVTRADEDWVVVGDEHDRTRAHLAFQLAPDLQPPRWPDPDHPQQMHIDVRVDDVDAAERQVLELGASRLPGEGDDFRVFADPAGHPFCLVWDP
jgi:catechol 2,3-dioxygenase-like lactoylglutathione lyase family enzyme